MEARPPSDALKRLIAIGVIAVTALAIAALAFALRNAVFGTSPAAIHDAATVPDRFTVCDRTYRGSENERTLVEASAGGTVVLVDPAPLAPCPEPNADGVRPCTRIGDAPCATVVYIRIGEDAYRAYDLSGGP